MQRFARERRAERDAAPGIIARQAQWTSDNQRGNYALAAARRFSAAPINLIAGMNRDDSAALLSD